MIHHTTPTRLAGPATRRIAVIQIPRAQISRLGSVSNRHWIAGPNTTSLHTIVPVKDLVPHMLAIASPVTAESWQAEILRRESMTRQQIPGTLSYVPAPSTPSSATVPAPWNTWSTAGCNAPRQGASSFGITAPAAVAAANVPQLAPAAPSHLNGWIVAAGILGAAASLMYLKNSAKGK